MLNILCYNTLQVDRGTRVSNFINNDIIIYYNNNVRVIFSIVRVRAFFQRFAISIRLFFIKAIIRALKFLYVIRHGMFQINFSTKPAKRFRKRYFLFAG